LDEIREQAAKKEVSYADFLDELPSESLGPPWRSVCPTSGRFEKIARGETKIVEKEIFLSCPRGGAYRLAQPAKENAMGGRFR